MSFVMRKSEEDENDDRFTAEHSRILREHFPLLKAFVDTLDAIQIEFEEAVHTM